MNQFRVNYSYLWRQRKPCNTEVLLFPNPSHLCGERYKETIDMQPTGVPPVSFFSESKCWEPSTGSCFLLCLWPGNWDQGSRITKGGQQGKVFVNKRRRIWDDQPSSLVEGKDWGQSWPYSLHVARVAGWGLCWTPGPWAPLPYQVPEVVVYLRSCLSAYLSIYLYAYLSIYPSIYLSIQPPIYFSVIVYYLSIYLSSIDRHSLFYFPLLYCAS